MKKHYQGIADRMLSEIKSISEQMSHQGEKGRNNELILSQFLEETLPRRYTVSTGKVRAVGGKESGQVDIIIHDRFNIPALMDGRAWSFVPVEAVYAVISVKTTLDKSELIDALKSIQSVRSLPRKAAVTYFPNGEVPKIIDGSVLRPRAYVFAYKSSWSDVSSIDKTFKEVITGIHDDLRPNGVCALNQGFIIRKPHTVETLVFPECGLMHFFNHLVIAMNTRPTYSVDLAKYFEEDYGIAKSSP